MKDLNSATWLETLDALRTDSVPRESIHKAIVKLGKPFNKEKIHQAKNVVCKYLDHQDAWVRHEAIWFLGCWGRLKEFEPRIVSALRHDPEEDNRAYAAGCLGAIESGSNNPAIVSVLASVALQSTEADSVRISAYAALLDVTGQRISPRDKMEFDIGRKSISDVDWQWVEGVAKEHT